MASKRLLFIINEISFFLTHRLPLAKAAKESGFEVHVAAPAGTSFGQITQEGFIFHEISLSRRGTNPFKEIKTLFSLFKVLKKVKPEVVHLVTIKPVLYGGLMTRLCKVPSVVAAISGLGAVFTTESLKAKCLRVGVKGLYRIALKHPNLKVIFQNEDDKQFLLNNKSLTESQTVLIRGSGVDLMAYKAIPETTEGMLTVIMVSRLLKDKGVLEFIEAAKILKAEGVQAQFLLIGESDYGNPAFIDESLLTLWRSEGHVELLGFRKDIAQLMERASVVVLPSYREGLPKVLVEAAACGRAVVTTDVPGCRDAIEPNKTGLLVPVRDAKALAKSIKYLLEHPDERQKLGTAGRALAEKEFAIDRIVHAHMNVYRDLETNKIGCIG